MADVGQVVDGRAADVHRHLALVALLERADGARGGVVKAQHPGTVTRSCHPDRSAPRPRQADPRRSRGPVGARLGGGRHLPLRRQRLEGRGLLHRHAPSDGVGLAAHGLGLRLRADRRHRPLPAHARLEALLPHGLGRQRAADRAPGADLLRRDVRPVAPLRPRLHASRGARARTTSRSAGPTSSRCATSSRPRTSGPSRACGGASGSRSTGAARTPRSTTGAGGPASACSCATWPGARPTRPRRRPCGTSTTRPRWPRPRWRTARCRAPTTGSASTTSRSRRPGPSWSPPAWRWWRTPTTSATRRASGPRCTRRSSGSRCPCWRTTWPSRTRARASP